MKLVPSLGELDKLPERITAEEILGETLRGFRGLARMVKKPFGYIRARQCNFEAFRRRNYSWFTFWIVIAGSFMGMVGVAVGLSIPFGVEPPSDLMRLIGGISAVASVPVIAWSNLRMKRVEL